MTTTLYHKKRHENLERELYRILPRLIDAYHPEKVIVFGSYVLGTTREWSDVDLAIIKRTKKRFIDRLIEVGRLADNRLAMDFLVYTPEEFENMSKTNYFVRDEIVAKGKVLYEKNRSD